MKAGTAVSSNVPSVWNDVWNGVRTIASNALVGDVEVVTWTHILISILDSVATSVWDSVGDDIEINIQEQLRSER